MILCVNKIFLNVEFVFRFTESPSKQTPKKRGYVSQVNQVERAITAQLETNVLLKEIIRLNQNILSEMQKLNEKK